MPASAHPVDAPTLEYYLAASARSPIALRLVLGNLLRALRKEAGIEAEAAGRAIRGSEAKISRMERAQVTCKHADVMDLLSLYGVTDAQVLDHFADMVRISRQPGWWHRYDGVLPDWCGKLIGLQEAASTIRTYEVQLVPGLLQTAAYAEAVMRLGYPLAPQEEIDDRVELRMTRQNVLARTDAPTCGRCSTKPSCTAPSEASRSCANRCAIWWRWRNSTTSPCRSHRSTGRAASRPASRSPTCASTCPPCPTSSISNNCGMPNTWTGPRRPSTTAPSWTA